MPLYGSNIGLKEGFRRYKLAQTIPANLGATRTAFAIAPTVQFHPHTSAAALAPRADGSFQGYISGTTLTVTTFSSTNARAITSGMVLKTGAASGTYITNRNENNGFGGTGQYNVSISQTVGSSSAPVTFTVQGDQATFLPDLMGTVATCHLPMAMDRSS